jgi:hypothetical protein
MKYNSFMDGSHVLWTNIDWLRNKRYPTGELVRHPNGTIKKYKVTLVSQLRIFPSNMPLGDAKEYLALEILQRLFAYATPQFLQKPHQKEENTGALAQEV